MHTYPKQELWLVCKQRVGKGFSEILFLGRFDIAPKSLSHPKPSHRWEGGLAQTPPIQISFIFFLDNLDYLKFIFFLVWFGLFDGQNEESFSNAMGSSVLITGKISTTPSQFRDPVILRVKTFIIGIYGKYESNVYMWAKRGGRTLAKLRRWSHVSFDFLHPYDVNYFYSMLYLIYLDRAIFRRANKSG